MFLFIQRHVKQVIFGTPTLTIWNLDSSLSKWKREHTDILGYIPTSPSSKDQSTCLNIKVCLNVNDTRALGATFSNQTEHQVETCGGDAPLLWSLFSRLSTECQRTSSCLNGDLYEDRLCAFRCSAFHLHGKEGLDHREFTLF